MKRDISVDIAKGIAIILMVIGHCDQLIPSWLFKGIFSFHVPLFFFFSGYFFSPKRSIKDEFKHSAISLLLPYLITGSIVILLSYILYTPDSAVHSIEGLFMASRGRSDVRVIFPYGAGPIWFLFALFWCRVLFCILYHAVGKWSVLLSMFIGVCFMVFGRYVVNLPMALGQGFSALYFYAGGYMCKILKDQYSNIIQPHSLLMLLVSLFIWVLTVKYSYLNVDQYIYHNFPLPLIGVFAGIYVIWTVSSWLSVINEKLIAYIGTYTLDILCCHTIAFTLCGWVMNVMHLNMHYQIVATILTIVLSVVVICFKKLVVWVKS